MGEIAERNLSLEPWNWDIQVDGIYSQGTIKTTEEEREKFDDLMERLNSSSDLKLQNLKEVL